MRIRLIAGSLFVFLTVSASWADPLGTAFTYQGRLKSGGSPANGSFNMDFRLYPVPAGGTLLASQTLPGVLVTDGLFTVQIDFGAGVFDGNQRWLDVTVNGTPLVSRQELTAAPHAVFAQNASTAATATTATNSTQLNGQAASFYQNASNINNGTLADARLSGIYSRAMTLNNASNSFAGSGSDLTGLNAGNITTGTLAGGRLAGTYANAMTLSNAANMIFGNGNGLTTLNAASLSSGTVPDARLPVSLARLNLTQTFSAPNIFAMSDATAVVVLTVQRGGTGGATALNAFTTDPDGHAARFAGGTVGTGTVVNVVAAGGRDALAASSDSGSALRGAANTGLAGEFLGDVSLTGDLTKSFTAGTFNRAAPIAYGFITAAGAVSVATPNVTSTFDSGTGYYRITIAGESYLVSSYVTVVTPSVSGTNPPRLTSTSSISGQMIVRMYDLSGATVQNAFQFVTYKP